MALEVLEGEPEPRPLEPQARNPVMGIGPENQGWDEDLVEQNQDPDGQRQAKPKTRPQTTHPKERSQIRGSAYTQEWGQDTKDS